MKKKKKSSKRKSTLSAIENYEKGLDLYYENNDVDKALKHLLSAAKLGYKKAYSEIGILFYREKNDPDKAEKWFQKSEKTGVLSPGAAYEYGMLHYLDKDDWETGLSYLFRSAEAGYEFAYGDIGTILFLYKRDLKGAEECFEKAEAADCLLAPPAYYYGLLLDQEKDELDKSIKYFRKSAEDGFDLAYGELGYLLYLFKKEIDEAEEWFEKAEAANCLEAPHAYEYGNLLINERGDTERGNLYIKKAEDDGY
jgi:TPR repeat protein